MTPQERDLITKLFERLAALENAPRDPEAERTIADGLARAPHAIYPLVQTVLVQDEALKAANAKIEELLTELGDPPPEQQQRQGGFLESMRDSMFGRRESPPQAGSVPSVPQGGSPWANAPGYRDQGYRDQGYRDQPPPGMGGPGYGGYGGAPGGGYGGGPGGGGGFLGTAAATAAGMIGGSLLLGGIRNMLGGHGGKGPFAGAFDHLSSGGGGGASPWSGGGGSGELGRQAGLDDIGRSPGGGDAGSGRAGMFDSSHDEGDDQDSGEDDDDTDSDDGDSGDDDSGSDDSN